MDITYLGHSSFRLRGKYASLITDPYIESEVGLKFPKVSADIVTVSHEHPDHNNVEAVKDIKKDIRGAGEYEISGISIIGIPTFHDDKKGTLRGKNTVYIIEDGDLRLVHLGDIGHKLSEGVLEEIGVIDVMMIPVGGVYTIGPSDAAEIVREIEPSIVIPMHYQVPGLRKDTFEKLAQVDEFLKEVGLGVERLDKLSVKKSDLLEEHKVVVLEKKS